MTEADALAACFLLAGAMFSPSACTALATLF
jgi:hypothetical protein